METFFQHYLERYKPFHAYWNYEDGCVLLGSARLYRTTRNVVYRDFVLRYLGERVTDDGEIPTFDMSAYNIDSINCGKALFFALDETGEARYRRAADFVMERLRGHPRCRCGSFWHKEIYPDQIWLDGLYMAQPFYLEYERRFNALGGLPDCMNQFENVVRLMFNREKGLFYHGYDESRVQPWSDPETGCSPSFWLRSVGWYLMALTDCVDILRSSDQQAEERLCQMLLAAAQELLPYAERETGLFYQVIDRADVPGNYLETSGSAMAAYAFLKGARLGALPDAPFVAAGQKAVKSLLRTRLRTENGETHLTGICSVAGLGGKPERNGTVAYYLSEPVVDDDPKGVGTMMMAYAEFLLSAGAAAQ